MYYRHFLLFSFYVIHNIAQIGNFTVLDCKHSYLCDSCYKVPLNNKETMLQRQISIDRDETETGLEALEEPLKAKKRRESRPGRELKCKTQKLLLVPSIALTQIHSTF